MIVKRQQNNCFITRIIAVKDDTTSRGKSIENAAIEKKTPNKSLF